MEVLKNYLNNLSYYAIIDLVVIILAAVAVLWFFKRRNNLKMALFVAVYVCAYIGACVASALTSINILFITSQVLRWGGIVLIFCIITTYQQDIKSSITRFARWHDSKDTYDYGNSEDDLRQAVDEIVKGCQTLSKNDTGA